LNTYKNEAIILESNLRKHEFTRLKTYAHENEIEFITFFLTADSKVLYERFKNRHIGRHHVHASVGCPSFDEFSASMVHFDEQFYGPNVMFVNTSQPKQIPYEDMLAYIRLLKK
jgi:gluconate kinase